MKQFGVSRAIYTAFCLVLLFLCFNHKPIPTFGQTNIERMLEHPYVQGELLVRFAPKETGVQKNVLEKKQILSTLGNAAIEESYNTQLD